MIMENEIRSCDVGHQKLYSGLVVALEVMGVDVIDSVVGDEIVFEIVTDYPHSLPERVAIMFFDIDPKYWVGIKETSKFVYSLKRHFVVTIRGCNLFHFFS